MARRYRLEYLKKKRAKERKRELRRQQRMLQEEKEPSILKELLGWVAYILIIIGACLGLILYSLPKNKKAGDE